MNLRHDLEFDVALRSVDNLGIPAVSGYTTLDARLGWRFAKDFELSVSGFNLLDPRHPEFGAIATRSEIPREVYLKLLWKM
jgi:iron complex outermembrane receptor protein